MPAPLRIVLCGASGRMGRAVAALAAADARFLVTAGIARHGRTHLPIGHGTLGLRPGSARQTQDSLLVPCSGPSELPRLLRDADMLIDFSAPSASVDFAAQAARAGVRAVIGTTGFTPRQEKSLRRAARRVALLAAPNMSPGINVLVALAARAARALSSFDAAVLETHHARKKDAPSGSARLIAAAARAARGGASVPALSLRVGDVVGDHTLVLAGPGERLELTHRAQSRDVFARGALQAALWLSRAKPGLYSMRDVLGV